MLCPDLCGVVDCPDVAIDWLDHDDGDVDARQPFAPSDPATAQGIDSVLVGAPAEAAVSNCWQVCDPAVGNAVASVTVESPGRIRIGLDHPMTPGEVTTISYRGNASSASFIIHPGNVTGNATTDLLDILALIDELTGPADRYGIQSEDIDRSGALGPGDLLRLIDIVQGGGGYAPGWNGRSRPVVRSPCIQ